MPNSVPQPPHSPRQIILTFSSAGSGKLAGANHWTAQEAASVIAGLYWDKH